MYEHHSVNLPNKDGATGSNRSKIGRWSRNSGSPRRLKQGLSTRDKYDRGARHYDLVERVPEVLFFSRFRRALFSGIKGHDILEVGVGTGKNIPYYPMDAHIVAIDFSKEMIRYAQKKAADLHATIEFEVMDAESLGFRDESFDTVVFTFVFCSVPDPIMGLREIRRILRPDGTFHALEHVRPGGRLLGPLFDFFYTVHCGPDGSVHKPEHSEKHRECGVRSG